MVNNVTPIPPDKIGETPTWREWFKQVSAYLMGQQVGGAFVIYSYPTTKAPSATPGAIYFDTTLVKFRVCEVAGVWITLTTP